MNRMAMAGSGGLEFFEARDARYECRCSDANRERLGALTKVNAALLSAALWVDRDAEERLLGLDKTTCVPLNWLLTTS